MAKKKILEQRLAILFILLLAIFSVAWLIFQFKSSDNIDWSGAVFYPKRPLSYRLIDGQIAPEEKIRLKPIAAILENHYESRPVSGLEEASIIYETVVEGDITRFLAIFDGNLSARKIGPVRSARPFFVELAEEWNPVFFHSGGSQQALSQLKKSSMFNVDEISADGIYFWRDKGRTLPHNLYTSANQIKRALVNKDIVQEADFSPWLFKNDNPVGESDSSAIFSIMVSFLNNPLYEVKYQYSTSTNDYTRYLANQVHKTEAGIILKAKNIVVQYVDFDIIDDYGRLKINLDSGGEAEIYQDGRKIIGYWKKTNGRTRFYHQNNEEIKFNRGTIWVDLIFLKNS